ncbi:hypothetical protein [Almyronema epifaneia]|uniref:Uncharacterized protein n=1 Tax=Almyronema epifaneia S1 TaxID=2991925 RepID=A0ABW6IBF8_9CYAN
MTHSHSPNNDLTQETNRAALETEAAAVEQAHIQSRATEEAGYVYNHPKDAPNQRVAGLALGIAVAVAAVLAIGLFVTFSRTDEPTTPTTAPALEAQ